MGKVWDNESGVRLLGSAEHEVKTSSSRKGSDLEDEEGMVVAERDRLRAREGERWIDVDETEKGSE